MKTLAEDTLEQFFSDVGFIPPKGSDNPMEFFVNDDSKTDTYSIENSTNSLFTDFVSDFIKHLDAAVPVYQEPPISGLNKNYQKKDLKRTHSFSDSKLEAPTMGLGEFPKHELAPEQIPDAIMDNKPYWLTHHE